MKKLVHRRCSSSVQCQLRAGLAAVLVGLTPTTLETRDGSVGDRLVRRVVGHSAAAREAAVRVGEEGRAEGRFAPRCSRCWPKRQCTATR